MNSISSFSVFVLVAEERSLVAAGRAMGISASAVGKRVGALEDSLGVRLFHRSTRSVTLTAEGEIFLIRSRRILAEIEAVRVELSEQNLAPRGRLRVSLPLVADPFLQVLTQYKITYPLVDLHLEFTDRRVNVIEEGFDVVIRTGEADDSLLTTKALGAFEMILVASPSYLEKNGTPLCIGELQRHACIRFRFPSTGKLQDWWLPEDQLGENFQIPTSLVCNNQEARIRFAADGVGIAYVPDFAAHELLREGKLVRVLGGIPTRRDIFRAMWPSGNHTTPKLRTFVDFLAQRLFLQTS